jgi:hypothetical protein
MNIYDIFGSGRKPAVTESKIEVVHEYVNEDFSGLMFGANNEDIAGPGGSDNNDSTSPIHGFGEDYDNIPDLENVGEQVVSIMDAERRLAQGDRIFAFHEMDEEPSEIHDVGQLAGYDAEQLLAVPQGVAEGYDDEEHPIRDDGNEGRPGKQRYPGKLPNKGKGVAEGSLNEFAPGDSGDDRTYEYEVYQCNPDDKFDWISEPLYKTDRMDKAHGIAYELWKKHPDKAFMIWQERSQGSRGGYGIKDDEQGVAEGLPQTLRKVVPGYAKREIDKKMDAGKFGKTDADKDANFQRYKKIQDKLKEQGVAEGTDERKQNALWAQITAHEKAAKASKDLKRQHHLKMADQLRSQLKTSDNEQGVAEAPHDDEVDYDDKYQAMVKRVGQKAREQQRHEPVDLVKLAQRLRQADKTTDTTDEDVMESRLSAMKRAGYDIL